MSEHNHENSFCNELNLSSIGDYQIRREIGRGGMGIVLEAHHTSLNRKVAIKVLPPTMANDDDIKERFIREARATAKLEHRNIVKIYDIGNEGVINYFVMEFISGKTLENILFEQNTLVVKSGLNLFKQIASGLHYAHEKGIIHRDIKPANIMIDDFGKVTITDFGIAKSIKEEKLTITGSLIGTPDYMSPEQAKGDDIDRRSDLFSLGIMMYESFTGKLPFSGETSLAVLRNILEKEVVPARQINKKIEVDMDYIISRCLQKNPKNRYQTAKQLLEDMVKYEKGEKLQQNDGVDAKNEIRFIRQMKEFFRHIMASFKIIALYASDHPLVVSSLKKSYESLTLLFKIKKNITFSAIKNKIVAEGQAFNADNNSAVSNIYTFIVNMKVESITFYNNISYEEFKSFVRLASMPPEKLAEKGIPLSEMLSDRNITHISVDEIVFERVSKAKKQINKEKNVQDDMLIQDYIMSKYNDVSNIDDVYDKIKNNPATLAAMISNSLKTVDLSKIEGGIDPQANLVIETLDNIGKNLIKGDLSEWATYKKNLANLLMSIEPESIGESVFLDESEKAHALTVNASEGFSDEKIVKFVVNVWVKYNDIKKVKLLISRLLADPKRKEIIIPVLKKELLDNNMTENEFNKCIAIASSKICEQIINSIDNLNSKELLNENFAINLPNAVSQFVNDDDYENVFKIFENICENICDDININIRVFDILNELIALLKDSYNIKAQELVYENIINMKDEQLPEVLLYSICKAASCLIYTFINNEYWNYAVSLSNYIKKKAINEKEMDLIKSKCASALNNKDLIKKIIAHFKKNAEESTEIMKILPIEGVSIVVDVVTNEDSSEEDSFESYVVGRKVAMALKQIGDSAVKALATKFANEDWRLARNAVRIFEDIISDKKNAALLATAIMHKDPRTRKSAILSLEHIKGNEAIKLLRLASMDKDSDVAECAKLALRSIE